MIAPPSRQPLRVAIAGLGPKGLYALERLVSLASEEPRPFPLAVDVYEPHPVPGSGPVYDPAQPEYLRMNFVADMVNMWPPGDDDPTRRSFSEWRRVAEPLSTEAYPPRALVGRYLEEGFAQLMNEITEALPVEVRAEEVIALRRSADAWRLTATEGESEYDEVLIAIGHAQQWDGALSPSDLSLDVVPAVFPVEKWLTRERVAPGASVAIRGFALTMIDAALALTEGRGGRFAERGGRSLRYESAQDEAGVLLPYSRTGRPMLAKPDPEGGIRSPDLEPIAAEGSSRIDRLSGGSSLEAVSAIVADVAEKSLRSVTADAAEGQAIAQRLEGALAGRATPAGVSPVEELARSIAVGTGDATPGSDWALGHAWRALYPALVARVGANGLSASEWPPFRRLATEMERLAFGPPPGKCRQAPRPD